VFPFVAFADDSTFSEIALLEETAVLSSETPENTEREYNTLEVMPLSILNGYEVYFGTASGTPIGAYDTLKDACDAVNTDTSGTDYTILVTADDPAMGQTASINTGKTVTLTSTAGSSHVITQTGSWRRHIGVYGSLILENITLSGGSVGGGVHVSGGTLVMNEGAIITECSASLSAGGIYLRDSDFTMNGGEISDNHQATTYSGGGGGVCMTNSTFTMNDGKITNNSSVWGGGVAVGLESTFTMNGGEISYNESTEAHGGGVHVYVHGTFIMNDGKISNNKSTGPSNPLGGGVFVGQGSHASTEPEDWCRFVMNGGSIEDNEAYIGGGVAAYWNGQIEMNGGSISSNEAAAGAGVYLGRSLYEDDGVSFTMNGGEITGNTTAGYYGAGIWARGDLSTYTVKVVIGDATGASASTPLIYGNEATTWGGGMFLYGNYVHATIYDGKIYENSAGDLGGGICVYAGGTLNMHGGTIGGENDGDANRSATSGGGIATYRGSNTFNMTGGQIVGNEANSPDFGGGGIYLADVSYSITGAEISNNTAANNGGGLYISNSATQSAPISNTSIASNEASNLGGGAYIENTTSAENIVISNNAASNGGGVYLPSTGSFTAISGTSVTNNSAVNEGGGIYTQEYTGYDGKIPGDYSGVLTGDYSNITTSTDTVFRGNTASAAYEPPTDADTIFSNIGYDVSSLLRAAGYINPINNYDINYAQEPAITYTVTYDAGEGTGTMTDPNSPYAANATVTILSNQFTRSNYTFIGFTIQGDDTGKIYASAADAIAGADGSFIITNDTVLIAQWRYNGGGGGTTTSYTVTYDANGGTGSHRVTGVLSRSKHTVLTLDKTGISRDGYTFTGWTTAADGSGTAYTADDTLVVTRNITLYAQWEKKTQLDTENHFAYLIGYPDGTIGPENNITRAEVSTIFFRLLTQQTRTDMWTKVNDYSDVPSEAWCNNAISTLTNSGILTGYPDGTFAPNATITRAEFAAIAVRFDAVTQTGSGDIAFNDISGHWAESAIKSAARLGYVQGYGDGTFRPDEPITRAEAATLLNNVLNRHVGSEKDLLDNMVEWPDNTSDKWYYLAVQEATNSHYYERETDGVNELWVKIRDVPNWAALEKPNAKPGDISY